MALDNLRDFLRALDARGELVHVGRPVSVDKEITEIADRCMKSPGGGPALLFEHPRLPSGGPARYPVAVNLFGAASWRCCRSLRRWPSSRPRRSAGSRRVRKP